MNDTFRGGALRGPPLSLAVPNESTPSLGPWMHTKRSDTKQMHNPPPSSSFSSCPSDQVISPDIAQRWGRIRVSQNPLRRVFGPSTPELTVDRVPVFWF